MSRPHPETQRRWYRARRQAGLCVRCGESADAGSRCSACAKAIREARRPDRRPPGRPGIPVEQVVFIWAAHLVGGWRPPAIARHLGMTAHGVRQILTKVRRAAIGVECEKLHERGRLAEAWNQTPLSGWQNARDYAPP